MEKCALILCEKKMSEKSRKSLADAEIVFRPMKKILQESVEKCGIEDIFFLCEKEERTENFRNFFERNKDGDIFVCEGTNPFISPDTITKSYEEFVKNGRKITAVVSRFCDSFAAVWMSFADLKKHCSFTQREEILLSDIVSSFDEISEFISENDDDFLFAKNLSDVLKLNEYKRKKILEGLMLSGVQIPCADGVIISEEAEIDADAVILKGTQIKGKTKISADAVIGPDTILEDCNVGEKVKIKASHCYSSEIKKGAEIGPFVRIRPHCTIGENARVGNFVELKNASVAEGAKISHLSYVGDSFVGKDVNIGCGCATVNFDGRHKHRTVISDGAFIGCGVNLVAPVTVGKDAFVAAGSTVTEDVPENALSIARTRQVNKTGWVLKTKPYKRMK